LVPTGGVTLANAGAFIEAGAAAVGVGADLVDTKAIRAGQLRKSRKRRELLSKRK